MSETSINQHRLAHEIPGNAASSSHAELRGYGKGGGRVVVVRFAREEFRMRTAANVMCVLNGPLAKQQQRVTEGTATVSRHHVVTNRRNGNHVQ
jgi:hypothetical protein